MLTPKQEAFCQSYIETGNASEAYRRSYDAENMKAETINRKACELLADGKVTARLNELRDAAGKRHAVTVASLILELEEARAVAKERQQAAAMVQATMGKAKLTGLDRESESSGTDLPKAIAELIAKLPG